MEPKRRPHSVLYSVPLVVSLLGKERNEVNFLLSQGSLKSRLKSQLCRLLVTLLQQVNFLLRFIFLSHKIGLVFISTQGYVKIEGIFIFKKSL